MQASSTNRPLDRRRFLTALGVSAASIALPSRSLVALDAPSSPDLAHDADRPEYHFIAPRNWMNDPNGPIWWKGNYHLFYQWTPDSAIGGSPDWGHAISNDMVHWRHLPVALAPTPGTEDHDGCWTGSAVVRDGVPTIIYTGVIHQPPTGNGDDEWRQAQMLATAADPGLLHWSKLPEPILPAPPTGMNATGFRDPCPWREADGWYLGVGSGERDKGGCVLLYRSHDLRQWEYLHPLIHGVSTSNPATDAVGRGDMWECPDFFEVNGKHCLLYSSENKVSWSTGDYDQREHRFTIKRQGVLDHSSAYYAPKSFSAPDGRRILWGWVRETRSQAEFAAAGWAGAISLPRVLTIGAEGQLEMSPATELDSLRGPGEHIDLSAQTPFRKKLDILRQELAIPLDLFSSGAATVRLLARGKTVWELSVDLNAKVVRCGQASFPLPGLPWPQPTLRLFLDGSIIELFVGGREALTSRVYGFKPGEVDLEIETTGKARFALDLWPLQAISSDRLTT